MSLLYAKKLVSILLASSTEQKSIQLKKLMDLLESQHFIDLKDKEIRRVTGLKQSLIENIRWAINNDPPNKYQRDLVIFRTKHGTYSLMNIGRRQKAKSERILSVTSESEESHA
jgi:hypothetical protein